MADKFELYKDKAGKFRFKFKANNGEVIKKSEGYKSKYTALDGIASVRTKGEGENGTRKTCSIQINL